MKLLLAFSVGVLTVGCVHRSTGDPGSLEKGLAGTPGKSETKAETKVETEARPLFAQAESLRNAGKAEEAIEVYQLVRSKFPSGRAAMLSTYRIGGCHYQRGDYNAAVKEFSTYLARYPKGEYVFDATYNLAASEFQAKSFGRAYEILSKMRLKEVQAQDGRRAAVIYRLTGQAAAALQNHPAAVIAFAFEHGAQAGDASRAEVASDIEYHLGRIEDLATLQHLSKQVADSFTLEKIQSRLHQLEPAKTETGPISGLSRDGPPTAVRTAQGRRIGILVPLTGKFAPFGRSALDSIVLSSKLFSPAADSFELVVGDTGSQVLTAEQELNRLVEGEQVIGVIGPLQGKEAQAVAVRCQQLGVPNLSLSTREGLTQTGSFVFQNALTPRIQVENLVEFAIGERGMRRFAILAPNDSFGRDMVERFWDATEKKGGIIVGYETYEPNDKDFQKQVQSLVGLSDPDRYRHLEVTRLQEFIVEQKKKTGREPRVNLPPVIDFDGLFVPDAPKNVAQIAASLRFFDVGGIPLMGTTDWGSGELARRGGSSVEGAIFPGVLLPNTRNGTQRQFISEYVDAFGTAPDIVSAQAFEAYQLMAGALNRGRYSDRDALASALGTVREWPTLLGTVSFDDKRTAQRKLSIYAIGPGGEIVEND